MKCSCGEELETVQTILTCFVKKDGEMSTVKVKKPRVVRCNNPNCLIKEMKYGYQRNITE